MESRVRILLLAAASFTATTSAFSPSLKVRFAQQPSASLRGKNWSMNLLNDIGKMASGVMSGGGGGAAAATGGAGGEWTPVFSGGGGGAAGEGAPPSWEELMEQVSATEAGRYEAGLKAHSQAGTGPAHTDTKVRLFGTTEEPRVTLFRDTAAWCPYCQKVWMTLEEKKIPYKIEKINMRSYGEKPNWFLQKVPSGLLPVLKLDERYITESLVIMKTLEEAFPEHKAMMPDRGTREFDMATSMLKLERELFGWWCGLVFRPSGGQAEKGFEETLDEVDRAIRATPGPWFMSCGEEDGPGLVDLTYVPHLERMAASVAYWKGMKLRGNPRWPAINRWFEALEQRDTYMASKSDFYTHVMDIPPQYGNGFSSGSSAQAAAKATIGGKDGSWNLPLPPLSESRLPNGRGSLEPCLPENDPGEEWARQQAAYKLISNASAVTRFAGRGVGKGSGWGNWPGRAPLADPLAKPNEAALPDVDVLLRHVANAMLTGSTAAGDSYLSTAAAAQPGSAQALSACAEYLRDRVGVPRDMPFPAARQFRAHLNWAVGKLQQQEA